MIIIIFTSFYSVMSLNRCTEHPITSTLYSSIKFVGRVAVQLCIACAICPATMHLVCDQDSALQSLLLVKRHNASPAWFINFSCRPFHAV